MKYRDISLNNNKKNEYSLKKYKGAYEDQLEPFDEALKNTVKELPGLFPDSPYDRDQQAYMLCYSHENNTDVVGLVYINYQPDENRPMELLVQFNEQALQDDSPMEVLDHLVESLKIFFYKKETFEITLYNDFLPSLINPEKYEQNTIGRYICHNEQNKTITKVMDEMRKVEEKFNEQKINWCGGLCIYYEDVSPTGDYYLFWENGLKEQLAEKQEVFNKITRIEWHDNDTRNFSKKIIFFRTGDVQYLDKGIPFDKGLMNCKMKGNLIENDFYIHMLLSKVEKQTSPKLRGYYDIELNENEVNSTFRIGDTCFVIDKKTGNIKTTYENYSSTRYEIEQTKEGKINYLHLDFRKYKKTNPTIVDETYSLKIDSESESLSLIKYNEYGFVEDLTKKLLDSYNENPQIFQDILTGKTKGDFASVNDVIKNTWNKISDIIKDNNQESLTLPTQALYIENTSLEYEYGLSAIETLRDSLPVPSLKDKLTTFLNGNGKATELLGQKVKKKDDK